MHRQVLANKMAGKERRRIQATQNAIAVGANGDTIISTDDTVNLHSLRVSFNMEPDAADANAHGTWVLMAFPESVATTLSPTIAVDVNGAISWLYGV